LQSPVGMEGNGRLERIILERNRLTGPPFTQLAQGTGETVDLDCGLLFRSIGYRGLPLPGLPFDSSRGVFPNTAGRIDGMPGVYATLARCNSQVLSYGDWRRIDAEEQRRGAVVGKPREKITQLSDMLALAAHSHNRAQERCHDR